MFRHSLENGIARQLGIYGQAAAAVLVDLYIGVLYVVMLKIVKSNDNVLSYTCV